MDLVCLSLVRGRMQVWGICSIWISKRYPYSQNTEEGPNGFVGTADSVRHTRDVLLTNLRNRGTPEAIAVLERAKRELNVDWMKWHVIEAKTVALWNAWKPITPLELLDLGPKTYVGPLWQTYLMGISPDF